jgi:hypothetical protein
MMAGLMVTLNNHESLAMSGQYGRVRERQHHGRGTNLIITLLSNSELLVQIT